ncbi:MAG: hypothetical protein WC070_02265 [Candidatus Magasanikbacteria bacterium]
MDKINKPKIRLGFLIIATILTLIATKLIFLYSSTTNFEENKYPNKYEDTTNDISDIFSYGTCMAFTNQTYIYFFLVPFLVGIIGLISISIILFFKKKISKEFKISLIVISIICIAFSSIYTIKIINNVSNGCTDGGTYFKGFFLSPFNPTPVKKIHYKLL